MNKIFTLLLVGALTAGAVTANAESQIFKKKKKKSVFISEGQPPEVKRKQSSRRQKIPQRVV